MKNIMLLMTVCAWWHNAAAQSEGGLQQYYYMHDKAVTITPIVWYQANKGWYLEGRYNYEAERTLSVYAGKTFEKQSTISYTISPLAGVLVGLYKGVSVAVNSEVEYKRVNASLQSQYVFSTQDRNENFLFNWCDVGYQVSDWLSGGLSLQHTKLYSGKATSEKGFYVKALSGSWEFPVYFFLPADTKNYAVMGLNYTLRPKNKSRYNAPVF